MSQASSVQQVDEKFPDLSVIVAKHGVAFVKRRPVSVSLWVLGLVLAAFANGFAVSKDASENYYVQREHADEVERKELNKALANLQRKEDEHYRVKGWFGACDQTCQRAKDKVAMARDNVDRITAKRDKLLTDARKEVGIWSTIGVKDVRASFWSAWESGKALAARWTMWDALFMTVGRRGEESMVEFILKIVLQYIGNLTMGLCGAFVYFLYNIYYLICSYGEPTLSGVAFFLLVLIAGLATIGTYLGAICGTVAGGGYYLVKQAAKQAAVEGGRTGQRRSMGYGAHGRPGRPHYE